MKLMNKLAIPAILVATVMVAGIFAFMPVQQASTVHTTIIAKSSGAGGFDTIVFPDPVTFGGDADRLTLVDIHEEVENGFVILRTDNSVTCTQLQVVVTNAAGAIQGSGSAMGLLTGAAEAGGFFERLCHGHIPTDTGASSVLVALAPVAGQTPTIPAHSSITTTIKAIDDDVVTDNG